MALGQNGNVDISDQDVLSSLFGQPQTVNLPAPLIQPTPLKTLPLQPIDISKSPEFPWKAALTGDPSHFLLPQILTGNEKDILKPDVMVNTKPSIPPLTGNASGTVTLPAKTEGKPGQFVPNAPTLGQPIISSSGGIPPTLLAPQSITPQIHPQEVAAAQVTKKVLNNIAPEIKKTAPETPGFWNYIHLASKANEKPPITNPAIEQARILQQQRQQEEEAYRKATQLTNEAIPLGTYENPNEKILNIIGQTSQPLPGVGKLGHLPSLIEHPNSQLQGLSLEDLKKNKIGVI